MSTAPETEQAICRLLELAKFCSAFSICRGIWANNIGGPRYIGIRLEGHLEALALAGGNGILTSRIRELITARGRLIGWSMRWMPFGYFVFLFCYCRSSLVLACPVHHILAAFLFCFRAYFCVFFLEPFYGCFLCLNILLAQVRLALFLFSFCLF